VCAGRSSQQSAHACLVAPTAASLQHTTRDVLSVTVHSCPCNRSASQAKVSHLRKLQRHMRINSTGVRCACDEDATPGGRSGCCCWRDLRALRMLSRFEPFLFHVNRGFGCGCSAISALPGCSCCTCQGCTAQGPGALPAGCGPRLPPTGDSSPRLCCLSYLLLRSTATLPADMMPYALEDDPSDRW
jgi:hypothetical protein